MLITITTSMLLPLLLLAAGSSAATGLYRAALCNTIKTMHHKAVM